MNPNFQNTDFRNTDFKNTDFKNADFEPFFALLDQRLAVLTLLSNSLGTNRNFPGEDSVSSLERRTCEQYGLLAEWARIEGALKPWRQQWPDVFVSGMMDGPNENELLAESSRRCREAGQRYFTLLAEIQQKCAVETGVLRRARRTAAALSSLLSGGAPTYGPPSGTVASSLFGAGK